MAKKYIGITDQLNIVNVPRANIDAKYGTYTSQSEALTSVPKSLREKGLTVGILVDGTVVEYWFKAGIEDVDLVPKQTGGGGTDGLDAIRISLSNMNVILKEGKTGVIENWGDSEGEMTVVEGDLYLQGVDKVHTETNSCFWIDEIIATGIAAGSITSSGNKVNIGRASDMVNSTATIKYVVKGLRKEGQPFTQDIYQKYTKVVDGKGMEINVKGTVDTVGIGDDYPVSPEEGHTHIRMYHGYVYKYVESTWTTFTTAELSDAYICRADGHLYIWDGDSWNDAGEFKGESGEGAYVHFAYADYIELDAEGRYISDSAIGFTVLDAANKAWLGHYWDYVEEDSQDPGRYTWSHVVLQNTFKSIVFTKSDTKPETPIIGGTYDSPYPTNTHLVDGEPVLTWSDGIPEGVGMVWSAYRIFTSDGKAPQMSEWDGPTLMVDTPDFDVEWSSKENPTVPVGHPNQNRVERGGDWSDNSDNAIWQATSNKRNGKWSEWKVSRIEGEKGLPGQGSLKSTMFTRNSLGTPTKPLNTDGSYLAPSPEVTVSGTKWTDGIPPGVGKLWATSRIFTSDGLAPQQASWTKPEVMVDSAGFDVEWSTSITRPTDPEGHPNTNPAWSNTATEDAIWMATSYKNNGEWSAWQVVKVKGETGPSGEYDPTKVSVPYMAGDWESGKEYVRDNFSYPVVSHGVTASEQPQFYFLKEVNKTITSKTPPSEDVTNWQPLSQFSMIFTESLFSEYSKLGSFQFNGRTMSSVEGNKPKHTDLGFIPNFSVDGLTGKLKVQDADITGTVNATSGDIGGFKLHNKTLSTGVSGLSGDNADSKSPVFWGGGTYEDAQKFQEYLKAIKNDTELPTELANFVVSHDGSVKVGSLIFDNVGTGVILDPITKKPSFVVSPFDIPDLDDLLETAEQKGAATNSWKEINKANPRHVFSGTISPTVNGSTINFSGQASVAVDMSAGGVGGITFLCNLYRNGVFFKNLYYRIVGASDSRGHVSFGEDIDVQVHEVPEGEYSIVLEIVSDRYNGDFDFRLDSPHLAWFFQGSAASKVHIGRNGFTAFYNNQYVYFSDTLGWKSSYKEPSNFWCGGSVSSDAQYVNKIGDNDFQVQQISTGRYVIIHSYGTGEYAISLSVEGSGNTIAYSNKDISEIEVLTTNRAGDSINTSFTFSIHV